MAQHNAIYFYNESKPLGELRYFDFCKALVRRETDFTRDFLQLCTTILPTEEDEDAGADLSVLYENEDLALRYHAVAVLFLEKFGFRVLSPIDGAFQEFDDSNYERFMTLLERPWHDKFFRNLLRSLCAMGFTHYVKTIYNLFVCAYNRVGRITSTTREWSKEIASDLARAIIAFHTPNARHQLSRLSIIISKDPKNVPSFSFKHPRRDEMIQQCEHGILPRVKSGMLAGDRRYKCLLHIVVTASDVACGMDVDV